MPVLALALWDGAAGDLVRLSHRGVVFLAKEYAQFGPQAALRAITPVDQFYVTSSHGEPAVDVSKWSLTIDGLVEQPLRFDYDEIRKLSDTQILVHNIASEQAGAARNLIVDQFPDWDVTPAPGEPSGYLVTMKQSRVVNIQQQTMDQAE